jgi:phosphohistidine phosphatase
MKTVYLLRHAQAESSSGVESDHERELTAQGERDARRLGRFLGATDQIPDRLVTSTAVRARATAVHLPEGGQWMADVPMREVRELYDGDAEDVLDAIRATGDAAGSVLVVGHQPTWSQTVRRLAGNAQIKMPTGTCACIDVDTDDWEEIAFGDGAIDWLLPPRMLR